MRHDILSPVACPVVQYFSTLSHTRNDFRGKRLLITKCVFRLSLQILLETFLILRTIQPDITINIQRASCKVPVILISVKSKLYYVDALSKNTQTSNFI
jgi:hypothetical protein